MIDTFGDTLMVPGDDPLVALPSPEALKNKILIKVTQQ
jgi:hypothetical protein